MKTIKPSGQRIILVRHGETEWNRLQRFQGRSDIPLNQKGRDQARALSLALKEEPVTAIYSSHLKRAVETATTIGRFHPSTPLIEEPGFVEMDLGGFEGMKAQLWAAKYQDFRIAWEKNPANLAMPNGESLEAVQQRSMAALDRICLLYPSGSTLLVCAHNFVIISLLCFASKTSLDHFRGHQQDTAALNVLYKDGADFQVERVNDCRHLRENNLC